MKEFNMAALREALEKQPTSELDAMLRAELEKELPDENAVRLILKILREREADYPVEHSEQIDRAWEKYRKKTVRSKPRWGTMLLRVASVMLIAGALLFALPQEADARNFFDRIAAWTDSIFALFGPGGSDSGETEYVFQTDHPGLQELYDTVTELGVTAPVVPMWLDESYELIECQTGRTAAGTYLTATFSNGEKLAVYELSIFSESITTEFHKDAPDAKRYEIDGTVYNMIQNEGLWIVVWTIENLECSLAINCQEDVLITVLDSICATEE